MEKNKDGYKIVQGPNGQRIFIRVQPPVQQPRQLPVQARLVTPVQSNKPVQPVQPVQLIQPVQNRIPLQNLQPLRIGLQNRPLHVRVLPASYSPSNQPQLNIRGQQSLLPRPQRQPGVNNCPNKAFHASKTLPPRKSS